MYLAKLIGRLLDAGHGRRYLGAERRRDRRRRLSGAGLPRPMAEREAMFLNALERTRRGVVACVFDTTDRVQHMFYRYLRRAVRETATRIRGTIEDLYRRMDGLVEKAMRHVDDETVLFVFSDHGFCSFRRGINLKWLPERISGAERWPHRERPLLQRSRLEPNQSLHAGPRRPLSEFEGARSPGYRQARSRG